MREMVEVWEEFKPRAGGPLMFTWGIRYLTLVLVVMGLFAGFVACGAQYYRVSLKEDTPQLTGSIEGAEDPTSPNFGLHAPGGWSKLPIRFLTSYELSPEQLRGLTQAMATWEAAVGRKLFSYEGVQAEVRGDSFPDLYSSLEDGVNGHYLDDNWVKTGKPTIVLATTIWESNPSNPQQILTADIRYNNENYVLGDSFTSKPKDQREIVDMQTLALHELGHLLGLAHISASSDYGSIMNASLYIGEGLANRRLSRGDILRIQKIYGCIGSACDVDRTLAAINETELKQRKATENTPDGPGKSKRSPSPETSASNN